MKARSTSLASLICRIVPGIVITTLGYHVFLNPHMVSVGGITGLAVLLNKYLGWSYTVTLLCLNLALFLWGIKVKGLAYVFRSLLAMLVLGLLLDFPIPGIALRALLPKTESMICGSVLTGIGYGLVVSADTSTGGSDLLAMIVTKMIPCITVGTVMNFIDFAVVIAGAVFEGAKTLLFSIAAVLLCNTFIDITAYFFGSAALPSWLERLKSKLPVFRKPIPTTRLRTVLYGAVTFALVIIIIRAQMIDAVAHTAPFA